MTQTIQNCFSSFLIGLTLAAFLLSPTYLEGQSDDEVKLPKFRAQTIDSQVIIGYGTAIGDVDGDGKPDILLADKKQFVWYQNPTWKRHVIAENLTERDNVCIAARDIDGDGKVEIAVGGQWNPGDTINSGSVHYLVAPEDRTQKWTPIELEHEPVVHRMRWVKIGEKQFVLVVAPLHGRGNKGGAGDGVKLLAYHKPADPTQPWKTEVLDDKFHITHNFDVVKWNEKDKSESVLHLGKEGAKWIQYKDDSWKSAILHGINGGGEIRLGRFGNEPIVATVPRQNQNNSQQRLGDEAQTVSAQSNFIATIEPFHGTNLVVYSQHFDSPKDAFQLRGGLKWSFKPLAVLDKNFNQGHAIAVADLLGNGSQQIVAGWRNPNDEGKFGIKLYYQPETEKPWDPKAWSTRPWKSTFIDENEMACEDLRIGDLNGDGRPDIVASGRSTHNLKVYWNEKPNDESE